MLEDVTHHVWYDEAVIDRVVYWTVSITFNLNSLIIRIHRYILVNLGHRLSHLLYF